MDDFDGLQKENEKKLSEEAKEFIRLEDYITSSFKTKNFHFKYEDIEISIPIKDALRFISVNKFCTCRDCSLRPAALCKQVLFAWRSLINNFIDAAMEWHKIKKGGKIEEGTSSEHKDYRSN